MKTVQVRVAVAVAESGQWAACGWSEDRKHHPSEAMDAAMQGLDRHEYTGLHWLEADIPIPEANVVKATVIPECTSDIW